MACNLPALQAFDDSRTAIFRAPKPSRTKEGRFSLLPTYLQASSHHRAATRFIQHVAGA
jgi:hypothetical protein